MRKFIYGPGIDEPICMVVSGTPEVKYFYHQDALGSVAALSKFNSILGRAEVVEKYTYSAFGETTVTLNGSTGNPYRFTGREYEPETGMYYYRARFYNPAIGRFLQMDPIGYADSLNLYQYCGNNPINWIDPWGLCKTPKGNTVKRPDGTEIPCPEGYDPLEQAKIAKIIAVKQWYDNVNHGGPWDWKREGHKDMEITHPEYEAIGNFDYGITGSAQGMPAWLLHLGARRAGGGEESEQDTYNINQGIQWYKENKHKLPKNSPPDTYWSPSANMPLSLPR